MKEEPIGGTHFYNGVTFYREKIGENEIIRAVLHHEYCIRVQPASII
jgi:hypothetical protein